jgi:hypothetical protein
MDTADIRDTEIAARLKRLDASAGETAPGFDYDSMLDRHAARQTRARRRLVVARGVAGALAIALVSASVWRFGQSDLQPVVASGSPAPAEQARGVQPRIVRADTWFAVAALEDHIASIDDALNDARLRPGQADVARLERTRAELVESYEHVRYAEMLSANL